MIKTREIVATNYFGYEGALYVALRWYHEPKQYLLAYDFEEDTIKAFFGDEDVYFVNASDLDEWYFF